MTFDVQLGVAQGCSLSLSVFGLLEQAGTIGGLLFADEVLAIAG